MMFLACVIGMFLLTWYFGDVERDRRNPNRSPESLMMQDAIVVSLKRNRQGHYLVVGEINNHEVEFLLDTGATDVVVPQRLAGRLGLPRGRRGTAMTANGAVTVYNTRIESLRIGAIELHDIDASINPAMDSSTVLLGMSALGRIDFLHQGDSLTLRQKPL